MPSASLKTLADDGDQSPVTLWTESDELGLLRAVQEMTQEPAEVYDPSASFARIERNVGRRLAMSEVLTKIDELMRRYEEMRNGEANGDDKIINGELFEISESIWGMGNNEDSKSKVFQLMAQSKNSTMLDSTITDVNEEDEWEIKLKKIKCAVGTMVVYTAYAVAKATTERQMEYVNRSISAQRDDHRSLLMERLTRLSDTDCREQLRMGVDAFGRLCQLLRETGRLHDNVRSSVEEQVARFLQILSHNLKNRVVKFYFMRSGETVSRHFHKVLEALISLEDQFLKQPDGSEISLEIQTKHIFWPYFKNCVGAIDGSHFRVKVAKEDVKRYQGRKDFATQNVLAACTFDLKFTYVLTGWEGSASDYRILNNALIRQEKIFVPQGKYYLVDAGFMLRSGFLTPFHGTRYHLKEYSTRQPENAREVYNHRHSSLRNAIERAFGVLKKRFPILGSGTKPHYPIETQKEIIYACCILHNYLMDLDPDEGLIAQVDQEVLSQVRDDEEEAPIISDDEEYRQGEILRQQIADEMWRDYEKVTVAL